MEEMTVMTANPVYAELLAKVPPRVIHTEEENEGYTAALYELVQNHADLSPEERDLADLLTLLIEDFEEKHYQLPKAAPLEVVSFLMDQHGLKQKDLVDVFGTPSIVSEVLSGKRDLAKDHIARLSERFHVSPELFF
jgi:HTH-type transcriptional regulator / antitoxin HigA